MTKELYEKCRNPLKQAFCARNVRVTGPYNPEIGTPVSVRFRKESR